MKDIQDEVSVVLKVLGDQKLALESFSNKLFPEEASKTQKDQFNSRYPMVSENIDAFEHMESHAKAVKEAVSCSFGFWKAGC